METFTVRNIPKFKDRASWSRDTFQPMRRRAFVYQQTNQNIAPVLKNFQNNGEASYKAPTKSERNLFFFVRVDFLILIQSSARTHVRMAVLIRCVTCFIFGDQEKFLAAKFTFQHFDLVSFTAERLFFSELRPSH